MIVFLIILGIILFLALLIILLLLAPIKVLLGFDGELTLFVKYLFIESDLLSDNEDEDGTFEKLLQGKKIKIKAGKKVKGTRKTQKKQKNEPNLKALTKFIARFQFQMLKTLLPYLKTRIKRFTLGVVGEDAAQCAIEYGAITGAASCLFTLLQDHCALNEKSKKNIKIYADFTGNEFTSDILIEFRFPLYAAIKANLAPLVLDDGVMLDILDNIQNTENK